MSIDEAERLARLLRAKDKDTRAAAARALGDLGELAIPVLLTALQDPDWFVRYRAVEALGMIKKNRVDSLLIPALADPRDHVRYMAAKMLGVRHVHGAVKHLEQLLRDENEYVRKSAAKALGEIAVLSSRPALEVALREEISIGVRQVIRTSLTALQGSEKGD